MYSISINFHYNSLYALGTIATPMLQMRKMKCKEVNTGLNSKSLTPELTSSTALHSCLTLIYLVKKIENHPSTQNDTFLLDASIKLRLEA